MDTFLQDIRYALRRLSNNPAFTAVVVVTLALGIGANSTIFSLVNAVMLKPVPGQRDTELVRVFRTERFSPFSYRDIADYRERNTVFSATSCHRENPFSYGGAEPELITGELVCANYFEVLGARPMMGRGLPAEADYTRDAHPVAVVSHNFWRTRMQADPAAIGKEIVLNGHKFTVVGVAPPKFIGSYSGLENSVWVPITMYRTLQPHNPTFLTDRHMQGVEMMARLKPGVTLAQAQESLRGIEAAILKESNSNDPPRLTIVNASSVHPRVRTPIATFFALLMTVVGMVLLIACANIANLLMARAAHRQKEISIRISLGASRLRLVQQLLTESLLLALAGGAAGIVLAYWCADLLLAFKPPTPVPVDLQIAIDVRVLLFTFALATLTGIVFGLAPALRAWRPDMVTALKNESGAAGARQHSRLRNSLVVAQVAVSLVLLIASGLFLRSLLNASAMDVGFQTRDRLVFSVNVGNLGYSEPEGRAFYQQLRERIAAQPGVWSVSLANVLPLNLSRNSTIIAPQGEPTRENSMQIDFNVVSPGFFRALELPLLQGRDFTDRDIEGAPRVTIVNETLARKLRPDGEVVGRQIQYVAFDPVKGSQWVPMEIVGVARNAKYSRLGEEEVLFAYFSLGQSYQNEMAVIAHTAGNPAELLSGMRAQVRAIDPRLPVNELKTMEAHMGIALLPARLGGTLLGIFGGLALLLASVGIYGVISYSVAQRTREIGVRMALGAARSDVLRLILGQGLRLTLAGVIIGVAIAFGVTRFLATFLYGVSTTDVSVFGSIAALLVGVALAATFVPAYRAMRVDPMVALRYE